MPTRCASVSPIVPVPQHTSKSKVSGPRSAQSPAIEYNFSAVTVLTWINNFQININNFQKNFEMYWSWRFSYYLKKCCWGYAEPKVVNVIMNPSFSQDIGGLLLICPIVWNWNSQHLQWSIRWCNIWYSWVILRKK